MQDGRRPVTKAHLTHEDRSRKITMSLSQQAHIVDSTLIQRHGVESTLNLR